MTDQEDATLRADGSPVASRSLELQRALASAVAESSRGRILLVSSALPASSEVTAFLGNEAISTLYRFQITFVMSREDSVSFDLNEAIGSAASFVFLRDGSARPMVWHGILSTVECLSELDDQATYRTELVPRLFRLRQDLHSNVFVRQSIPEILEGILQDQGFAKDDDYELRLLGSYAPMEHVCQYRETNFDFVSRWMEREGIYYFFDQADDRERVLITDAPLKETLRTQPILYRPVGGDMPVWGGEAFSCFLARQTTVAASVRLRDYDYLRPDVDVFGRSDVTPHGIGEVVLYGENFASEDEGARLAKLYAERLRAHERVYYSLGAVTHVRPGYTYLLDDHPRGELNGLYLTTRCEYSASARDSVTSDEHLTIKVKVTSIPGDVPFRPEKTTPAPRIHGFEIAVVDGEADSPYAQIDEQGRYLVKLHLDESDRRNGKASTWVRMLQPHGGGKEGFHFPLRKGTEVLLAFLGGDPDRPVIAGVAPNANTPSPVVQSNHTLNVLQTGGENRVEMEDKGSAQYIDISTPVERTHIHLGVHHAEHQHNFVVSTDGNGKVRTGKDYDHWVEGNRTKKVEKNEDTTVRGNRTEWVEKDEKITIEGSRTETVEQHEKVVVKKNRRVEIGGDDRLEVSRERHVKVTMRNEEQYEDDRSLVVSKLDDQLVLGRKSARVDGPYRIVTSGGFKVVHGPPVFQHGGPDDAGATYLYLAEKEIYGQSPKGSIRLNTNEHQIEVNHEGLIKLDGKNFVFNAADSITLCCGKSEIELKSDGTITIKGQKTVHISGTDAGVFVKGSEVKLNSD